MARVLVTGGCGFLGGWVVQALLAGGHAVRVFDARPRPEHLQFVAPGLAGQVEMLAGDVTDPDMVANAAEGCARAVHLAGIMTVDCARDPIRGAKINLIGSLAVFEAARRHGLERVAYVSTAGVYGPDDGQNPMPHSHYGTFKLAVEGSARAYWRDHGLASIGFRPTIVYGPGESSGISAGPSIACRAAAEGRPGEIRFTGSNGFVHVGDVARAFARAVDEPSPQGAQVYDMVGITAPVEDFASALRAQVPGADITLSGPPLPMAGDIGAGKPRHRWELPITPIAEGIARTLAHYRQGSAA